jgi:2,5-furandicarboxylate decarboxylase 1
VRKDLRQFLEKAKEAGQDYYVEVKKPLKPELELDVLQLKLDRDGRYPIIFCPRIEGSGLPLVTNLFGSYEMLALALDMEPNKVEKAQIFDEYRKKHGTLKSVKNVSAMDAPVKEVVLKGGDVDLGLLPIIHHAELDSGKYITVGQLVCKDPDTGVPNVGVYRHEVKGKNKLAAMLLPAHHAGYILRRYAELGKGMEVAIFLGHHPAVALATLSRGGLDMNEFELMGGFLGESVLLTQAETVDLPVPADAEIVIEGKIDPNTTVSDGPLAEWLGYYGGKREVPLIQLTCLTMRKDAIYHDLANSQREHVVAGVLETASAIYDAVKRVVPTVKAVHMPYSGRCIMTAYVSIAKRVPGEGKRAALAAVNCEVESTRTVVVVDEDIDVYDEEEVLWAINTRVIPDSDIIVLPGVLGCNLVPTSYNEPRTGRGTMNTKMIIDATKPVGSEFATRVNPPKLLWDSMKIQDYLG